MKKLLFLIICCCMTIVTNAQHKVGDIYNKDGVKGIIVKTTDDGAHGLLMSLEGFSGKWLKDSDTKFETEAFHEDDGAKNMKVISQYITDNNKSWEEFPLFEWAKNLGDGWYIPASDELSDILKTINGGTGKYNEKIVQKFGKLMKKAKGKSLIDDGMAGTGNLYWMYSSTETAGGMVNILMMAEKTGSVIKGAFLGGKKKGDLAVIPQSKRAAFGGKAFSPFRSRAVHKF